MNSNEIIFEYVSHGDPSHAYNKERLFNEFKSRVDVELRISFNLNLKTDVPGALDLLKSCVPSGTVLLTTKDTFIIYNDSVFIDGDFDTTAAPFNVSPRHVTVKASGSVENLRKMYSSLYKYIKTDEVYIHWWYPTSRGIDSVRFSLEDTKVFKEEHYPFIPNANNYIDEFINSSSSILILLGDPGTGKTSFIRQILKKSGLQSYVTYDEGVMMDDQLYTEFLSDDGVGFLILEDADLIMADRQRDGNRVMSKILNASDGLVSFQRKKIIFTANIRDVNRIDEAMMRPGRCHGLLNFRPLTVAEVAKVAEINNITLKDNKSEMSLAEIFNQV